MTTDRNALIEAAARVLWRQACSEYDYEWDRNAGQFRREAAEVLDAVLPLIADAIETLTKFPPSGPFGEALGIERAARLVRSLARPGTGE